MNKADT